MSPGNTPQAGTRVGLVVVAAGASRRFGANKLKVRLSGRTVLERAVAALRAAFPRAPLAVVVPFGEEESSRGELSRWGVTAVVAGGKQRQDSVKAGVAALSLSPEDVVVIHDGARPFVPVEDVQRVVAQAKRSGAAILVAPLVDTIKEVSANELVKATVPRERLRRALTPQAFRVELLERAWAQAPEGLYSDEAALVESLGAPVDAVPGDPRNIKLTCPEDLSLARGLFPPSIRVGQGVDVHPFAPGKPLILAGVRVPSQEGLAGHSDADVVLHALTDAILAACGAGDLGEHFPPTDPQWRGADSTTFLAFALEKARAQGLSVVNCSVTLLAEKPRIAPYRQRMRDRLAELLGVSAEVVNIAATTTEAMGFVGRGEGVAALAMVLLAGE